MSHETLQTVERALKVLRAFSRERTEFSQSELAHALDLPRSVVIRLTSTLEQAGFLERTPGRTTYRIGLAAFEVGALYLANNPLARVADEVLADVVERAGHTGYLGALYGNEVVILAVREGHSPVRFRWSAGDRLPATTTAIGKAILMHLPSTTVESIFGDGHIAGLTERSIRTRTELDHDLQGARERGWASAEDESYPTVSAVGAAILTPDGTPLAGISLSFLNYPPDLERVNRLGTLVQMAAGAVSERVTADYQYGQRPRLGWSTPIEPQSKRETLTQ